MSRPTDYWYQWKSAGENATGAGATTATYTVMEADVGKELTCMVTGSNAAGSDSVTTAIGMADIPAYPAQVIDLRNWYLGLPVDSSGGTVGASASIKQTKLATYALSPFFVVDPNGVSVNFEANCGGATTSGSTYPRSELREMYNSGTKQVEFSLASGTHTMTVEGCILALPPVKPQTVFGQIHDPTGDVIELLADGKKRGTTPGSIYLGYRFLGAEQSTYLDTNYVLGTRYTVEIHVADGLITISYNGTVIDTRSHSASGCYFKAGNYTQSNVSKGDAASAYAQTRIYALSTSHSPISSVASNGAVANCGNGSGYATS